MIYSFLSYLIHKAKNNVIIIANTKNDDVKTSLVDPIFADFHISYALNYLHFSKPQIKHIAKATNTAGTNIDTTNNGMAISK